MPIVCRRSYITLCLSAIFVFGLAGCNSRPAEAAAGAGTDISGPVTMNADYGARNPRVCAKVTSRPDAATALALVQCHAEGISNFSLWLVTDLQVEMGSPRAATAMDTDINDLDAQSKIYPLRGQGTNWSCGLVSQWGSGTNCQKFLAAAGGTGRCWHTLFGEWKCSMSVGSPTFVTKQPGPTTY